LKFMLCGIGSLNEGGVGVGEGKEGARTTRTIGE
jgi:hypothetical protein